MPHTDISMHHSCTNPYEPGVHCAEQTGPCSDGIMHLWDIVQQPLHFERTEVRVNWQPTDMLWEGQGEGGSSWLPTADAIRQPRIGMLPCYTHTHTHTLVPAHLKMFLLLCGCGPNQLFGQSGCPVVTPHHCIVEGFATGFVPHDGGFPLICNTNTWGWSHVTAM